MDKAFIDHLSNLIPEVLNIADRPVWFDYDREADVLYVSFRRSQDATETIPFDEHILMRKHADQLVGLTVLNAGKYGKKKAD